MEWFEGFLIKRALAGSPIMARLAPSPADPLFPVPEERNELSDYRLAEQWVNDLAPMYRSVPLARARARMSAIQGV
jgi:hypothetical protein